jgi:hypothetical protein
MLLWWFGRVWYIAAVTYVMVPCRQFPGWTEINHERISEYAGLISRENGLFYIFAPHSLSSFPLSPFLLPTCLPYSFHGALFSILSLFLKTESRLMRSTCCLCIPPIHFWMPEPVFMKLGLYIYHGTWAHFNGGLPKSLPSLCMYVYTLSLLGNGSVKTLPRQRIHTIIE